MLLFILLRINFSSMKHYFLYIFLLFIFSSCGGSKRTSDYSFLYEDEDGMEFFIDSLDLEENSFSEIVYNNHIYQSQYTLFYYILMSLN